MLTLLALIYHEAQFVIYVQIPLGNVQKWEVVPGSLFLYLTRWWYHLCGTKHNRGGTWYISLPVCRQLLHSSQIDVSYFAAGIVSHLVSDGSDSWDVEEITRDEMLEDLVSLWCASSSWCAMHVLMKMLAHVLSAAAVGYSSIKLEATSRGNGGLQVFQPILPTLDALWCTSDPTVGTLGNAARLHEKQ